MKLATIIVLCLAFTVHQTRAEPFIFDVISEGARAAGSLAEGAAGAIGSIADGALQTANGFAQGVIDAATGITQGVVGVGTGIVSNLGNVAASFSEAISKIITEVKSKALQSVLQQVQTTIQKIQDATKGLMQATEIAGQKIEQGIIELESKQEENINAWADSAKNKLADSSEDAQIQGQDLIEEFANQRAEDLKACTDKIVSQLEQLQEKANATAKRLDEPMGKLVQQVGKCAELKANDFRGLASCAADTSKALKPLLAAPGQLASVKAQIVKVGLTSLPRNLCVATTLAKFRQEARRVDREIDQLVAEDKKKAEEEAAPEDNPSDETNPEEETAPAEEDQPSPADEQQDAPAEGEETAPADE